MKITLRIFSLTIFLATSFSLFSQSQEFIAGYMVLINQDTLHGFIKDEKRSILSQRFLFKKTLDSREQTITASEAKGFHISPYFFFDVVEFNKNGKATPHFLRQLIRGEAALYQYFNNPQYQYVIIKNSGESIQISKKDSMTFEGVIPDNKYVGKIKYLLRESPTIRNAKHIGFGEKDLIRLVSDYNDYINPNNNQYLGNNRKLKVKIGAIVSFRLNNINVNNTVLPNIDYKDNNIGLQLGGLINVSYFRKIALQLGLTYNTYYAENEVDNFLGFISVSSKFNTLEVPVIVKYNLTTKELSPYLYGSFRVGKTLNPSAERLRNQNNQQISFDTYDLNFNDVLGYGFGAGLALDLGNNFNPQIEFGYHHMGMNLDFNFNEDVAVNSLNFGMKVFF